MDSEVLHVPRGILKSTSQFRFVIIWPFRTLPRPKTNNLRNNIWPSYYVLLIACRDAGAVGAVAAVSVFKFRFEMTALALRCCWLVLVLVVTNAK